MTKLTKILEVFLILLLTSTYVLCQHNECGFKSERLDEIHDNERYKQVFHFESKYREVVKSERSLNLPNDMFENLPIIVHVIHEGDSLGSQANPKSSTIRNMLADTNDYFRQQNTQQNSFENPYYGADTKISFCLTGKDEFGYPSTGIERYVSTSIGPDYLSSLVWNTDRFINVFILKDFSDTFCATYSSGLDIIRIANRCSSNSILAHELGHYLDLKHTFLIEGDCDNSDCTAKGDLVISCGKRHRREF